MAELQVKCPHTSPMYNIGQYMTKLVNALEYQPIFDNIGQYWTISECSLQHHNSDKSDLKY